MDAKLDGKGSESDSTCWKGELMEVRHELRQRQWRGKGEGGLKRCFLLSVCFKDLEKVELDRFVDYPYLEGKGKSRLW